MDKREGCSLKDSCRDTNHFSSSAMSGLKRTGGLGMSPMEKHNLETKKKEQARQKKRMVEARRETLGALTIRSFLNQLRRMRREANDAEAPGTASRVDAFEAKGRSQRLLKAESDLKFMVQHGLFADEIASFAKEEETPVSTNPSPLNVGSPSLGRKSVYYNPEYNPLGNVPKSTTLPNLSVPLSSRSMWFTAYKADPLVEAIPMPDDPIPPRFYKLDPRYLDSQAEAGRVKTEYVGSEEMRPTSVLRFVPASVRRKVLPDPSSQEQALGLSAKRYDSDDEEKAAMASVTTE